MTTIIGTLDGIWSDSQCSDSDMKWAVQKIERIAGALYATAGGAADGERFLTWIRKGRRTKRPVVDESFSALVLNRDGLFLFDTELYPMKLMRPHAIGSGGKAALALLLAGVAPARAIEICCEVDAGSGLPIQHYRLDEKDPTE